MKSGRPALSLTENLALKPKTEVVARRISRRIWIQLHGPIPKGKEIDHRDRNPFNTSPDNLRLATRTQNNQNKDAYKTNVCGEKNVSWVERDSIFLVNVKAASKRYFFRTRNYISAVLIARMMRRYCHSEFALLPTLPAQSPLAHQPA